MPGSAPFGLVLSKRGVARIAAYAGIVTLIVLPLIAGSLWIYEASAGAFRFQHDVREAQNARAQLTNVFLGAQSDVRGFAATGDPYFAQRYQQGSRTFAVLATTLREDLSLLGIGSERSLVDEEQESYRTWMHTVALSVLSRRPNRLSRVLRVSDPLLAARIASADRRIGSVLDDAAARSESDRQLLLRRILVVSVALVGSVAAVVLILLLSRAAAEQRKLRASVLYDEERRVSRMLQKALAPERLPPLPGVDVSATYVPAALERQIGGDWYEALALRDERILLIIGDVAGHGLPAAVIMNRARQAILGAALTDVDPARILQQANRSLTALEAGMVTAACCVYDSQTLTLAYATAGHPPPIVVPAGGPAFALPSGGPPLGIVTDLELGSTQHTVAAGTMVILYTDGLIEEGRDVIVDERRLLAIAERHRTSPEAAAAIFGAMLPEQHPRDDVAILTMRIGPQR